MKRLDTTRRELVAAALCEGNSLRATARLTGSAYTTILRFVEDMGWACQMYLDEHMRNLPCRRLQCDELWAFVSAKDKNDGQDGVAPVHAADQRLQQEV